MANTIFIYEKEKEMKLTIFAHSHCTDGLVAASIMKYSLQMKHNNARLIDLQI